MAAANLAMRGRRSLAPVAGFFTEWELECVNLSEELENGSYRPGAYRYFKIYEPKERMVAAAPFRDRVVHHALVRMLEPLFEPRFLEDSFACRKGKGTHAGMRRALHPDKYRLCRTAEGVDFCSFVVRAAGRFLEQQLEQPARV